MEVLSECHWNGWCIVTMERFRELCGGTFEGSVVLSHLSAQGKARYLSLPNRGDLLQVHTSHAYACVIEPLFLHFFLIIAVPSRRMDLLSLL